MFVVFCFSVVSFWCMFDRRNNIGVVHIVFMSVDVFALTNDIYIWIFLCALHAYSFLLRSFI